MCTPCMLQYWCSTNATLQHTSTNQPPTHTNHHHHHHIKAQPIKQVWYFLSQGARSSDKIQSFYSCDRPRVDLNGENVHWSRAWRGWSVSWQAVCSRKEALGPEIHCRQVDLRERQRLKYFCVAEVRYRHQYSKWPSSRPKENHMATLYVT